MSRQYILLIASICIITGLTILFMLSANKDSIASVTFETTSGEYSFICEIADTNESRRRGLLGSDTLNQDEGMFFIYEDAAIRFFTMKNMQYPLDIIFIAENHSVVRVVEADIGDVSISSFYPAQYVVEINQGLAAEYGIVEETNVSFFYVCD